MSNVKDGELFCHYTRDELNALGLLSMKNILIVYAHMEPRSFNAALLDTAVKTLESQGHEVTVSDLYAMKFNPVISRNDTTEDVTQQELFQYASEMGKAVTNGTLSEDIKAEQSKVDKADLIIFQFPMQWYSIPAILKGWLERVMLANFAFAFEKMALFDKGLLHGKKAILSLTVGSNESFYTPNGLNGDIRVHLAPTHSSLRFCGLDIVSPHVCFAPGLVSQEKRVEMLERWKKRLENIFDEPTGEFPKLSDGMELSSDYKLPSQTTTEFGASVAQHMGRKLPPNTI